MAYSTGQGFQQDISDYLLEHQEWPVSLTDLGYQEDYIWNEEYNYGIEIYDNGIIGIDVGIDELGNSEYVVIEPIFEGGTLSWICYGQDLSAAHLPPACR